MRALHVPQGARRTLSASPNGNANPIRIHHRGVPVPIRFQSGRGARHSERPKRPENRGVLRIFHQTGQAVIPDFREHGEPVVGRVRFRYRVRLILKRPGRLRGIRGRRLRSRE